MGNILPKIFRNEYHTAFIQVGTTNALQILRYPLLTLPRLSSHSYSAFSHNLLGYWLHFALHVYFCSRIARCILRYRSLLSRALLCKVPYVTPRKNFHQKIKMYYGFMSKRNSYKMHHGVTIIEPLAWIFPVRLWRERDGSSINRFLLA